MRNCSELRKRNYSNSATSRGAPIPGDQKRSATGAPRELLPVLGWRALPLCSMRVPHQKRSGQVWQCFGAARPPSTERFYETPRNSFIFCEHTVHRTPTLITPPSPTSPNSSAYRYPSLSPAPRDRRAVASESYAGSATAAHSTH